MITPMMLAIVIRMLSPNVITRIPRLRISGSLRPKDSPKFNQESPGTFAVISPIKPPYAVYFQGGLTWYHAKLGILMSLQKLVDAGIVTL